MNIQRVTDSCLIEHQWKISTCLMFCAEVLQARLCEEAARSPSADLAKLSQPQTHSTTQITGSQNSPRKEACLATPFQDPPSTSKNSVTAPSPARDPVKSNASQITHTDPMFETVLDQIARDQHLSLKTEVKQDDQVKLESSRATDQSDVATQEAKTNEANVSVKVEPVPEQQKTPLPLPAPIPLEPREALPGGRLLGSGLLSSTFVPGNQIL